jgi:fluoride ion exporter CrcB/FEX
VFVTYPVGVARTASKSFRLYNIAITNENAVPKPMKTVDINAFGTAVLGFLTSSARCIAPNPVSILY